MLRIVSYFAVLLGCLSSILGGMLAYARQNDPLDWVVFNVETSGRFSRRTVDVYRVMLDGTRTQKLMSGIIGYPVLRPLESNPGWFEYLESDVVGGYRLRLLHLAGHSTEIARESPEHRPDLYHYDHAHQRAYVMITDKTTSDRVLWEIDLNTGQRIPYAMPQKLIFLRYWFGDEGFVFWSDHASAGDLYVVRYADLPKITPLTTSGTVLQKLPFTRDDGWIYYYTDDGDPDEYLDLYRVRDDGSETQLVATQVLIVPDAMDFNHHSTDMIYVWTEHQQLFQFGSGGGGLGRLLIRPISGKVMAWSPDEQWCYYAELIPVEPVDPPILDGPRLSFTIGDLRRVNMQTGEDQLVWNDGRPYTLMWSADGQTLLLMADNPGEFNDMKLFAMQPDGSEVTVLLENIQSSNWSQLADPDDLLVLATRTSSGSTLHILDPKTLEIRHLPDDAPPQLMREVVDILPMPDFELDAEWLAVIGIGMAAVGVGVMAQRRG